MDGCQMDPEHLMSKENCLLAAGVIQWFSIFDIIDGMRAKNKKCGSPLGRVIDEAGDMICQTLFSILVGKAMGTTSLLFDFSLLQYNTIFFVMETRHLVTKELVLISGPVGPVEVELLLTVVMLTLGIYGPEVAQ